MIYISLDPEVRVPTGDRIEKYVIREAFDDKENPFIPDEVLWRQKEQFSDGVGYDWIDSLVNHCGRIISDEELKSAYEHFPINTPKTKEALLVRRIFHTHFPSEHAASTVHPWTPKWQTSEDPSGRASTKHVQTHQLNGTSKN